MQPFSTMFPQIRDMADILSALGYEKTGSFIIPIDDGQNHAYIYSEIKKRNGAPLLWMYFLTRSDEDTALLDEFFFNADEADTLEPSMSFLANEGYARCSFNLTEAPRWLIIIGQTIALLDPIME